MLEPALPGERFWVMVLPPIALLERYHVDVPHLAQPRLDQGQPPSAIALTPPEDVVGQDLDAPRGGGPPHRVLLPCL